MRYSNMATAKINYHRHSDEGPRLVARVDAQSGHAEVAAAVDDSGICDSVPISGEKFASCIEGWSASLYLNEEQCHRVNEKYEQEMDRRLASGGLKVMEGGLRPDPRMNESYFIAESH